MTIWINGTDVTTELYGSASIAGGSAFDQTFDITSYITEDAPDLYQEHTIQIKLATDATSTNIHIPDYTTTSAVGISFGEIICILNGVATSQAIVGY